MVHTLPLLVLSGPPVETIAGNQLAKQAPGMHSALQVAPAGILVCSAQVAARWRKMPMQHAQFVGSSARAAGAR
jgi:hypothetical protein